MNHLKSKKMKRADYKNPLASENNTSSKFIIIDKQSGEVLNYNNIEEVNKQDGY